MSSEGETPQAVYERLSTPADGAKPGMVTATLIEFSALTEHGETITAHRDTAGVIQSGTCTITQKSALRHVPVFSDLPAVRPLARFTESGREPYGQVHVTSMRRQLSADGFTARTVTDSAGSLVRFTGDPADQITMRAGGEGWRTTAVFTGVVFGADPSDDDA